jgi:CelD/BcsL family acetyltransferase involved in cellulose biosynthesis
VSLDGTRADATTGAEAGGGPPASFVQAWDDLAVATGAPPFLRPGWVLAAYEHLGEGEPEVVAVRRGGALVGVLPLVRRRRGLRTPAARFTPWSGPIALDAAATAEVLDVALALPAARLSLSGVTTAQASAVAAAAARRHSVVLAAQEHSPRLDCAGHRPDVGRPASSARRRKLRQAAANLARHGAVEVEHVDSVDGLHPALEDSFVVEQRSWKGRYRTAGTQVPGGVGFLTAVSEWAAREGGLWLDVLRVDGRPVAFTHGLVHAGTHYALRTAYDPAFRDGSPGLLTLAATLERCGIDPRVAVVDLCGDDDAYKRIWAGRAVERNRVQVFHGRLAGPAQRSAALLSTTAARRARQAVARPTWLRLRAAQRRAAAAVTLRSGGPR